MVPGPRAGATFGPWRNYFLGSDAEPGTQVTQLGEWTGTRWGLLWAPSVMPTDTRAIPLCDGPDDTLSNPRVNQLNAWTGGYYGFTRTTPFREIVGRLLTDPPPLRWNRLGIGRDGWQRIWWGPGAPGANLLWSRDTGRRSGPHSKDIQDTFNRADSAISGSTSSDTQFTWSLAQGSSARWNVVSNQAVSTRTGSDIFTVGLPSLAMDTTAHYGQLDLVALTWISTIIAVEIAVRIRYGTNAAGDEGYSFQLNRTGASSGGRLVYDWMTGSPLSGASDSTLTTSGTIKLSFDADNAYIASIGGTPLFTGTDTTYTTYTNVCPCTYVSGSNSASVTIDNFRAADLVAGGRTTKNTRAWPLGTEIGMGWRMPV